MDNDYVVHNTPNAGSYGFANTTSLNTKVLSASANLSSQVTGGYFNASGDVLLHIPSSLEGGVNCSNIDVAEIVPENVTFNVSSSTMSSCVESIPNPYYRLYTIHIATSGSISSGSPSSFYFSLRNTNNQSFISLVGTPDDSPRVFVSADINFSMSSSPELEAIGEINQNIVVISEQIEDLSNQMSDNTEAIINNQNENTEAIIKSNQHCYTSKNLIYKFSTGTFTYYGVSWNYTDETITASGLSYSNWSFLSNEIAFGNALSPGTYTFSIPESLPKRLRFIIIDSNGTSHDYNIFPGNKSVTFTTNYTGSYYRFAYLSESTNVSLSLPNKFMLESGSSVSSYDPYGEVCKNIDQEFYDEQRQGVQNISDQSVSDIQGSENQTTTNLIGVLSGFISAFSNINATNCNLTLEFPNYAGGTRVVDICQGKERAPRIVEIGSSLLLIGVFVPLAYFLIKMIYNEIRSWTNG